MLQKTFRGDDASAILTSACAAPGGQDDSLLTDESALTAGAEDHLAEPAPAAEASRRRFWLILAACLFAHVLILAAILYENNVQPPIAPVEEIPVELVQEIPQPKVEPPPPPQPPKKEEKRQKQKIEDDDRVAYDAPRAENKEKIEREAPNPETKAQRQAPPTEQTAETPSPPQKAEAPPIATVIAPPEEAPAKIADDKPDAEPLDKATPSPKKKPTEAKSPVVSKAPPTKAKKQSVADQLASLAPTPDYKVGSAAKPSPVAGGAAKTTYLSILYGLIMRQMHVPADLQNGHLQADGIVAFYVDERGNLTHQAIYRASGRPDFDAAALNAVRRAAPFPAPPRGDPHSIWFHYDTR